MKELNFPQEGGEYYWIKSTECFLNENDEVVPVDDVIHVMYHRDLIREDIILGRAFTLGELVRMMPDGTTIKKKMHNAYTAEVYWKGDDAINTSPEEAAAELAIELVGSGVIKFNINQKI